MVVELGCGDGSKTRALLAALAARDGAAAVRFAGVDVSAEALVQLGRTLRAALPGLPPPLLVEAEYAPGLRAVRRTHPAAPLCLLWLGSSVGNFSDAEAAELLVQLAAAAEAKAGAYDADRGGGGGGGWSLLLCTDLWKHEGALRGAYCEGEGVTEAFIRNGMHHALRSLGHPAAGDDSLWAYLVEVNVEAQQASSRQGGGVHAGSDPRPHLARAKARGHCSG